MTRDSFTVVYKEKTHHDNEQMLLYCSGRLTELGVTKSLIRGIMTVSPTVTHFHSQNAHRPVSTQKVI